MSLRACCILCKCLTVSSRMSAFSSLDTFSPCACKAAVMMSLSSSRHLLIRARRFLSSKGFIIWKCIILKFRTTQSEKYARNYLPFYTVWILTFSRFCPRVNLRSSMWTKVMKMSYYLSLNWTMDLWTNSSPPDSNWHW